MTKLPRALLPTLLVAALLGGCGGEPTPAVPTPAPPADTAAALKAQFEGFVALGKAGDKDALARAGRELLPTREELRTLLRPGPESETWLAAYKGPTAETPPKPGASAADVDTTRQEIHVHAATTEEIIAYVRDSVAWKEFPGGMRRFAQRVAAPGRTWYTVEAVEPGKESGTRFTCFTHVGGRFVLVLRPWRAMPAERNEPPDEPNAAPDERTR
jgi:hypothetical protein